MPRARLLAPLALAGALAACGTDKETTATPAPDAAADTATAPDSASEAAADSAADTATEAAVDSAADTAPAPDAAACAPPPAVPAGVLKPVAGELFYAQLPLGGFSIGESAILVGPDGTVVVIDVGNDSHDDDVAKALSQITGATKVDHIVITHFHADHGDGLAGFLGRITLKGKVFHRGLTDFTAAANDTTIQAICNAAASRPGVVVGLCNGATTPPCTPSSWTGSYPVTACPGLASADLALGGGAQLDFVAANGFIGADRYDTTVSPFLTSDNNGENARSVLSVVRHGAFRMLLAGDLTGGGSVTDDVESFYATRLGAAAGIDARGVDVLHASHHGRNTSSNATWVARLLPADGRGRNAVMGVSTAHVGSPHAEVLTNLLASGRLGTGRAWTTLVAATGANATGLIDAGGGRIVVATLEGGAAYAVQALRADGTVLETRTYRSVHACP
jgi:beta-lactamase superfamily II metal-dependent hydrolase